MTWLKIFKEMYLRGLFMRKEIKKRLVGLKLIVSDVDGVLTDGSIIYGVNTEEYKCFNVKDGIACRILQREGIKLALISGGSSQATKMRAKKLSIEECHTRVEHKDKVLIEIQNKLHILPNETAYLGDDVNDLDVLPFVSLFIVPNDAHFTARKKANIKLRSNGGRGVMREFSDLLMMVRK